MSSSPKSSSLPGPVNSKFPGPDAVGRHDLRHARPGHLEVAEHLVGRTSDGVAADAAALSEEEERPAFLRRGHRPPFSPRETVDGRVCEDQRQLEFRDRLTDVLEENLPAVRDMREDPRERRAVAGRLVQESEDGLANRLVAGSAGVRRRNQMPEAVVEGPAGAREARHLDLLGRRNVRLSDEQEGETRVAGSELRSPLRRREDETRGVVERISGRTPEPPVPHQLRVERIVDHHRRATLVARARAAGAHDSVVLDADGDRLRVAKAVGRRVAAGAGVVAVEAEDAIEEEIAPEIREHWIDTAAQARFESGFDPTGETLLRQDTGKLVVDREKAQMLAVDRVDRIALGPGRIARPSHRGQDAHNAQDDRRGQHGVPTMNPAHFGG